MTIVPVTSIRVFFLMSQDIPVKALCLFGERHDYKSFVATDTCSFHLINKILKGKSLEHIQILVEGENEIIRNEYKPLKGFFEQNNTLSKIVLNVDRRKYLHEHVTKMFYPLIEDIYYSYVAMDSSDYLKNIPLKLKFRNMKKFCDSDCASIFVVTEEALNEFSNVNRSNDRLIDFEDIDTISMNAQKKLLNSGKLSPLELVFLAENALVYLSFFFKTEIYLKCLGFSVSEKDKECICQRIKLIYKISFKEYKNSQKNQNILLQSFDDPEDAHNFITLILMRSIEVSLVNRLGKFIWKNLSYDDAKDKIYFNKEIDYIRNNMVQGNLLVLYSYKTDIMTEDSLFSNSFDCAITILKTYYFLPVIEINTVINLFYGTKFLTFCYFGDHHTKILDQYMSHINIKKMYNSSVNPESENFEFVHFDEKVMENLHSLNLL